jgi:site-specific recombinase XerD
MADKTREAYLWAVTGLAKFHRRSPDQISDEEVQAYLLHLIRDRHRAWSTCNIVVQGLRVLYHTTLRRERTTFTIPSPRQSGKLPVLLSREEIQRLLAATHTRQQYAILATTYGAGLRLGEVIHLRVSDIDGERLTIRVEQGKGGKDRSTLLLARLLETLRAYWRLAHPTDWLFPGKGDERPLDPSTVQRLYGTAKARAGITKPGGIHSLRHAFATHLLETGVDIHTIQRLLGHGHISTTMRYFHLAQPILTAHRSPLDLLDPLPELPPT